MTANRRRDTRPELAIRSLLHRAGLLFRVDHRIGTGRSAPRPDIVFTKQRIAVCIDGCFWHHCPEHATMPKSNRALWESKLRRNIERDRENNAALEAMGWTVLRFWEHEAPEDVVAAVIVTVRTSRRR